MQENPTEPLKARRPGRDAPVLYKFVPACNLGKRNSLGNLEAGPAGRKRGQTCTELTVLEWQWPTSNIPDTTNFQLDLDEPQSAGAISSFVYPRQ